MRPIENLIRIEVASSIAIAANMLKTAGASYQILPERVAPLGAFRGRNVILFGDPQNSNAVDQQLKRAVLTVDYDAAEQHMAIRDRRKPASAPPLFSRKQRSNEGPAVVYGLVTVLPTEGATQGQRTVVVSGNSTVGIHGGMEFLASPENMSGLRSRFIRQGLPGFPRAYQVVVRCNADDMLLLSCEYATHEVLPGTQPAAK